MWRSKKFIVIALAAVLLVGSAVGVVLAADNGDEDASPPEARQETLLDKVCAIYEENTGDDIDPEALKDAFAQAQSEMRTEALESRLQNLVELDKITQDEADEYKEWLQSKPDVPIRHGLCGRGGHRFGGRPCPPLNN